MKPIRAALAVLVVLAALAAAACGGDEQTVPAGAVAVVDGRPITQEALDGLLARAKVSYQSQKREFPKAGTPEYQDLQTQGVAFLVNRAEFDNRAEELKLTVTDKEIDERIALVLQQTFGGDQKKLDEQMKAQGYTTATLREDIRATMLSEKIFNAVTKDAKVTDAEIAEYFNTNKIRFAESRDVRHILVKTKAEADKIYDQLKAGADFAALAKKHSTDPGSKDNGGQLPITKGSTVAAFDATAFLLPAMAISHPVKTEFGYHVIQPLGPVKPAQTLKEARATIEAELLEPKKKEVVAKWSEETKKYFENKVAYAAGFAPPAAATQPATTTG